jgi:hypothetical protein
MASSKHKKRVLRELAANPLWRVFAGPAWVCPYCGEAAVKDAAWAAAAPDEAAAERAFAHLAACPGWREFDGRPLAEAELEARAHALRAREGHRRALISNQAWQLYDVARRWYCPFCAQPTAVQVPEGGRISTSTLREIERHLGACYGYAKGRGEEKPLAYLKSMVAYANRTRKMAEQIRQKIQSDASWRLRDADGRWVCPYCRKVVEHIDFSSPVQMVETAPLEISKHLVSGCERFRGAQKEQEARPQSSVSLEIARLGSAPSQDLVRLSGLPPVAVSGEFKAVGAAASGRMPAMQKSEWRESIRTTLSEVRSQVPAPAPAADAARAPRDEPGAPSAAAAAPPPLDGRPLPEIEGVEIRTFFRGARAHASDFADVLPIGADQLAVVIGAVSGDGAESGLLLPMVRNLFRIHGKSARAPADVLRLVNHDLFAELDGKTLVAVSYGTLDVRRREYRFARGGTAAPILFRPGKRPAEGRLEELESSGMVLGIDRGPAFDASLAGREARLETGDLLVHYTHGAVAAEDLDGRDLSPERFQNLVRRYGGHEADYFITKFGQVFEDWTRGAPLTDDACVVAIKIK